MPHYGRETRRSSRNLDRTDSTIIGGSLAQRLADGENFDYRAFAREFSKATDAINTAHTSGIIHRDIKPSNLLIDREHRIWVTDFGLAHMDNSSQLTRSGDLVGTFQYMSPEQASGHSENIDLRTDVYSLGATLYEVLSRKQPFFGWTGPALLKQIQTSEPPRLKQLVASIPRDLETIVRRPMRPDKADRYRSAHDMTRDLERFADGKAIYASRVTIREQITRLTAKNAAVVSIGFLVRLICLAAVLTHSTLLQREKTRTIAALQLADCNYQKWMAKKFLAWQGRTILRIMLPPSLPRYRLA